MTIAGAGTASTAFNKKILIGLWESVLHSLHLHLRNSVNSDLFIVQSRSKYDDCSFTQERSHHPFTLDVAGSALPAAIV